MKNRTVILAVVVAILCSSLAVYAEDDDTGNRKRMRRGPHKGSGIKIILRLKEKLDLSDEQVEQLEAVHDEHQPKLKEAQQAAKEKHEALRDAVEAGEEEAAIRAAAEAVGNAMGEHAVLQVAVRNKVDSILTEEQKEKLDELKKEFRQKAQKRRGDGKGRRRGRGNRQDD